MPKVYIDADEQYPVYTYGAEATLGIYHFGDGPFEVDDETYARWERISGEYNALQAELEALRREAQRQRAAANGY